MSARSRSRAICCCRAMDSGSVLPCARTPAWRRSPGRWASTSGAASAVPPSSSIQPKTCSRCCSRRRRTSASTTATCSVIWSTPRSTELPLVIAAPDQVRARVTGLWPLRHAANRWQRGAVSASLRGMSAHDHPSRQHEHSEGPPAWKHDGVRVIPGDRLDPNTAQTPGMDRKAAITFARVGAQKLWAGTVTIHANAKTGAHHHGHLESVIYIVKGRARMRWGEHLEFTAEAGPGDFIYVPPYVPHQEINAIANEALECVLCRSDGQAVAVNLDIEPVEKPEQVLWVDPTHPGGAV